MDMTSSGVNKGAISLKLILKKLEANWVSLYSYWSGLYVPGLTHDDSNEVILSGYVVDIMMALVEEMSAQLANTLSL
ncbi:hypothetical protein Tco_1362532 [Tanacetum coccineum]